MISSTVILLLATGVFYNDTPSLLKIALQEAGTNSNVNKAVRQDQAKMDKIPKWLKKLVHEYEVGKPEDRPERIVRYTYRNGFVFFLESKCCDRFDDLYDIGGKQICSLGGKTGRGDGKCPEFFRERKDEKVIWEDTKKR